MRGRLCDYSLHFYRAQGVAGHGEAASRGARGRGPKGHAGGYAHTSRVLEGLGISRPGNLIGPHRWVQNNAEGTPVEG